VIFKGVAAAVMVDRDGQRVKHAFDARRSYPLLVSHVPAWACGAAALAKQANGDIGCAVLLAESALGRAVGGMLNVGLLGDLSLGGQGRITGSIVPAGPHHKTFTPAVMEVEELSLVPSGGASNPGAMLDLGGVRREEVPGGSLVLALRAAFLAGISIDAFLALLPPEQARTLRRLVTSPPRPGGEDPLSPTGTNPVSSGGSDFPHAALYGVRADGMPALSAPMSLSTVRAEVMKHVRAQVRREELVKDLLLA